MKLPAFKRPIKLRLETTDTVMKAIFTKLGELGLKRCFMCSIWKPEALFGEIQLFTDSAPLPDATCRHCRESNF